MIHVYADTEGATNGQYDLIGVFYDSIQGRASAAALVNEDPDHRFAMVMLTTAL